MIVLLQMYFLLNQYRNHDCCIKPQIVNSNDCELFTKPQIVNSNDCELFTKPQIVNSNSYKNIVMADNYLERKMEAYRERQAKEDKVRKQLWRKRLDAYKKKLAEENK